MEAVADNMAILHRHEIKRVFIRLADIAVLDIDISGLIHLDGFVRLPVAARQPGLAKQNMLALLAMQDIPRIVDGQPGQIQIMHAKDIQVAIQLRRAGAVRRIEDERRGEAAAMALPMRRAGPSPLALG